VSQRELDPLLWELLDGTIDADGRAWLESRLAADADAREKLAQIRKLVGLLESVEELEPPETLKTAIDDALAGRRIERVQPRGSWTWLGELFAPRWRVRLAWAIAGLAVGVAGGILLFSELPRATDDDVSRFYGAMTRTPGVLISGQAIDLPDSLGTITVQRHGNALLLTVALARQAPPEATLALDGERLRLEGLSSRGAAVTLLEATAGHLALSCQKGSLAEIRLSMADPGAPLKVRLLAGQKELVNREFRVDERLPGRAAPTSGRAGGT